MIKPTLLAICTMILYHYPVLSQRWKDAGYKPEPYRKVMVYAKVSDFVARRQLEDNTIKFLSDKGIVAIPAYASVKPEHTVSREAFLVLADSLQVDALLVYEVNGAQQHLEQTSTVSVGVGVAGMYGGYAGASVPIAGTTTTVTQVKLSTYFYNRASKDEQWANDIGGTMEGGATDKLAYTIAKATVKAMIKDGLFILEK